VFVSAKEDSTKALVNRVARIVVNFILVKNTKCVESAIMLSQGAFKVVKDSLCSSHY